MTSPVRVAILASGNGSNALALLGAARELADRVRIPLLICDRGRAPILTRLQDHPVRGLLIERDSTRAVHEQSILGALASERVDWIFLAGYMRLLSPEFVATWRRWHGGAQQIVNIHPSLLPAYPGLDAVARAVAAGEPEIGVTLHYVDEGMDTGCVIAQKALARTGSEPLPTLMACVHALEHHLYTGFLAALADGQPSTVRYRAPR